LIFKRRKIIDTKKLEDFEEIDENKQKTDFKEVINIF
jgi:hypothetical protein